ncbi:hypothetical protein [Algoriphagus aquimarinus]|uniref:hypothetical protein n=1 Tax=Algoriphagus aquimarinus TaxID=237018 RepID=UPI0030D7754E|tara:strand:+ start:8559 stop:8915 length:357 start_codon:yes stop_codon:yes gene_type:complete
MKKSIYPILFFLLIGFACEEKDDPATACGVSDPIENLPWLKQLAESASTGGLSEYAYITQAKYKGKRVFYQGSCCPNCSWALILLDCEGNRINEEISFDDLEDSEVIWKPGNSECVFG